MELDLQLVDTEISEREKKLFDEFLSEYYKDYDAERACLRLGVEPETINKALMYFHQSPYIQKKMADNAVLGKPDTQENVDKAFFYVVNKLRSVAEGGTNKEKLDACKQLALIYGLNKPVDIRSNSSFTNVIMTPTPVTDAEWEEQASVTMEANYDGQ